MNGARYFDGVPIVVLGLPLWIAPPLPCVQSLTACWPLRNGLEMDVTATVTVTETSARVEGRWEVRMPKL